MFDTISAKRNVAFVALAIGFVFLLTMTLQLAAVLLLPHLFGSMLSLQILNAVTMYGIAMPLSLLFLLRCDGVEHPERRRLGAGKLAQTLFVCFAVTYFASLVGEYANRVFSTLMRREAVNQVEEMTDALAAWEILLFIVILAPIFEELFFRKLVIDRLLHLGELPAILLSGLAFGLIHGNFTQFFYAAGIGILFGFVYVRSGNVLYSIGLHMVLNFIGGLYTSEASKLINGGSWGGIFSEIPGERIGLMMHFGYLLLLAASVIVTLVSLMRMQGKWRFGLMLRRPYPAPTRHDWVHILLRNPAVWFFLAVVTVLFML